MTKMKKLYVLFLTILCFASVGCLDIFQTIEIGKDNVLTSFIRLKAYIAEEKMQLTQKDRKLSFADYPDLVVKSDIITKENYQGVDIRYSIPLSKLKSNISANLKKEILQPPYLDKNGQLVFVFIPDQKNIEDSKKGQDQKMAEGILGMFSYKMYFPSEWKPKSAVLRTLETNQEIKIEVIPTGTGVLLDFPMRYVVSGSILTIAKTEKVDSKLASDYINTFLKEKEIARKKEEEERKKEQELERKRQEEYEKEEAKREAERRKQQQIDDSNDGEEE